MDAWLGWHFGSTAWLLNFLRLAGACLSIGLIVLTGHTWKSKKFGSHQQSGVARSKLAEDYFDGDNLHGLA